MPKYHPCSSSIKELANEILFAYETHKPLIEARVRIDFVFAFADEDEEGNKLNDAIRKNGRKVYAMARIINLKDRSKGQGDAEITIDGDWWGEATDEQQRALLDHELHHFALKTNRAGMVQFDDLKRPLLRMRKHDYEFGWFTIIAERHGKASVECQQAREIKEMAGQFYWPSIIPMPNEKVA
jgi:hypothetical protein